MSTPCFVVVNQPESEKLNLNSKKFSLSARSKTDIYCSPITSSPYVFNAPIVQQSLQKSSFSLARLSLSFHASIQFDQAGLLFTVPTESNPFPNAQNSTVAESYPAWVKAGIEVNDGKAWISVVAREPNGWCDWSLVPIPGNEELPTTISVTIEVTRYKNALMIWMIEEEKVLIRKVPWVFLHDSPEKVWVGAYAARPDPNSEACGRNLEVEFRDLMIETTT